ncbi:TPA: J domain-containing protein [Legionella pneumophila]|uniref:J domain-containing protein n=1 Tax=Legionella pneumophila TaxID=446 RepID=A0AAN5R3Y2_LEGPN|nr:J domain-containing protein [Legionella pneumophila]HAT1970730.1 J domain-containing protein [Legionella pneumophila]HAT6955242.1 J domain-containing protein [Legionella pneumophila]HEN4769188.1 J domain-containing protein [Legionella pneumophila]
MTIERELKNFVRLYAEWDTTNHCYKSQLDKDTLLRLERDFARFINQQLLIDGPEKEKIVKNYKRLTLCFHPDHISGFSPEVLWLENNLSQTKNNGACFKIFGLCYEKLISPEKFKNSGLGDIKSKDDFKLWLESLRSKATTYSGQSFCDSLIDLLDQSSGFFDDTGKIKPKGLRVLLRFIPVVFASYGTFLFAEELFAIYALYFILLKGGQYLESTESSQLKKIGCTLQEISIITATASTTLLVRLLEMTFWASRQFLDVSLQIGSAILKPMLPSSESKEKPEFDTAANLCRDLILASHNTSEGMQFKTPELKVISAPLESYLGLNAQQFFGDLRIGREKRLKVEAFLFKMRVLDSLPSPLEEKLVEAQKELDKIKKDTKVFTSNTARAVKEAEQVISLLQDQDSMQLVVYKGT